MANSRDTFETAILPHLDAALTLARWLMKGAADAEDVVQDAVMRALTYYQTYRGENPRAWLLQIVRNVAYGSLKLNRGLATVMQDDAAAVDVIDPAASPEKSAMSRETRTRLMDAIAALPAELRETLVLRELEELSYKEIAQITAVPIGTVMSRLWRARRLAAASLGAREDVA